MRTKCITLFLTIIFSVFTTSSLFGGEVKLLEKLKLPPGAEPLQRALDFCVTDDELLMIPDYDAGNIKIYEKRGAALELVNTIGREGFGMDDLGEPAYCFYNKNESKFGFIDYGLRKVIVYDRIGRLEFNRNLDQEFLCLRLGYDIQLKGDKLFISGYRESDDGKPYDLYYIDIKKGNSEYLVRSYQKYELSPKNEDEAIFLKKGIGVKASIDVQGDNVYFAWEGNLRIIRLNIETKEWFAFRPEEECNYIRPRLSEEVLAKRAVGDFDAALREREKMCLVRNLFVDEKNVLVVYEVPLSPGKESNFWLQFYTLEGEFINEKPIPDQPNRRMAFDKERNILYSLVNKEGEYFVLKYKITQ